MQVPAVVSLGGDTISLILTRPIVSSRGVSVIASVAGAPEDCLKRRRWLPLQELATSTPSCGHGFLVK